MTSRDKIGKGRKAPWATWNEGPPLKSAIYISMWGP